MQKLTRKEKLEFFEKMLLIREFDESATRLFTKGEITGSIHACCGQEAVAVGVCSNLLKTDYIVSNHRGHGHNIAKGADPNRLMAELYGKKDGYCKGKGGSLHMAAVDKGVLGCNGIVGAGIPIATGVALAIKQNKEDKVVVCFFGDGASNEGVFHESLNIASLWNLPIVFIVENNQYAVTMSVERSIPTKDISIRAVSYDIPGITVDGMNVIKVFEEANKAIKRAREGNGPTLLECQTYRLMGHSRGDPLYGPYRSKEEYDDWKVKDPILQIVGELDLSEDEKKDIKSKVDRIIKNSIEFAQKGIFPDLEDAYKDVL